MRWRGCGACQGAAPGVPDSGWSTCQPLSEETLAISLASVLGAGQDADGTIYVVDEAGSELRAFISEGGELYRQRVSGSGQVTSAAGLVTVVSLLELEPPLTLQVEEAADHAQRMGVFSGPLDTKSFSIGEQGEELTLLTAPELQGVPLHNYPAEILVEYSAELTDGRWLVVLRPRDFDSYEQFRVFFGPPERLAERRLLDIARARDGGSTSLVFDVDGEQAHAEFPIELVDEQFVPGDPSLELGGTSLDLTLQAPAAGPDGASYFCSD